MVHAISLFSSLAEDIIVDQDHKLISKNIGGPLIFLKKVFEEEQLPLNIFSKEEFKIEIILSPDGEVGKVNEATDITSFPTIESDYVVISTILNEWDISSISNYKGKIFLDIQGYVRREGEFGSKKTWTDISKIQNDIFCLKGTEGEFAFIPQSILEAQKKKLLIVTHGDKVIDIFSRSEHKTFQINGLKNLEDTIGAGDTFFGYFISYFFRYENPFEACLYAQRNVEKFLSKKQLSLNS